MSCVSVELVLPLALLVLLQCFLISHTSFIICVCIRSIPHPLHTAFNISVPAFCISQEKQHLEFHDIFPISARRSFRMVAFSELCSVAWCR